MYVQQVCLFLLDTAQSPFKDDLLVAEVSERRALAKEPELPEKKKEDFFDLIDKLDKYNEIKEKQERSESSAGTMWHWLHAPMLCISSLVIYSWLF